MKKFLVVFCILTMGSRLSFGSQGQSGHVSQFHSSHAVKQTQFQPQGGGNFSKTLPFSQSVQSTPGTQAHTKGARWKPHNQGPTTGVGFVSATQLPVGGQDIQQAQDGDFNGDGKKDLVTLIGSDNNCNGGASASFCISVVLNSGNGNFQTAVLTPVTSSDPILVGDLNGDHKDDIIQVHPSSVPPTFDVWFSNGDGTFTQNSAGNTIPSQALAGGVLADLDGDGKLDILVVDMQAPASVLTLQGNGHGTFSAPTSVALTTSAPSGLVFADFNGDGIMDFAGLDGSDHVQVYLGTVTGYQAPSGLTNPGAPAVYDACNLSTGDLNGDGKPEIVAVNCSNNSNDLTVYVNNGDGTFQTGVNYDSASTNGKLVSVNPSAATIADVNGDGKNDIIVTNSGGSDVSVLLGAGDGTVRVPALGYAVGGSAQAAAMVADFNGDGLADIVVPDNQFSLVYLQGYGDGSFRAATDYYLSDGASVESVFVASGDFNGDGLTDIVVGNIFDSSSGVTVFLARPDGSLAPGVNYGSGGGLAFVAVGDFNGDKILDIAASDNVNGVVQIFLGNGDGTFNPPTAFSAGSTPVGIVAGDFNHDGKLDLAVANLGTPSSVSVLLGDGTGNFSAPATYTMSQNGYEITAADLNGDGNLDLIVPLYTTPSNGVAVFLGKNDGTFNFETDVALTGDPEPFAAAVGDLDGDGIPDLAVSVEIGNSAEGIAIASGNGDGTFKAATIIPTSLQDFNLGVGGPSPSYLQLFDLDGDGNLDLIYANENYGTVGVMFGQGNGSFSNPVEYPSAGQTYGLTLADINGDGATDVVVAGFGFGGASVLLNNTGSSNALASSVNPVSAGQSVTFTATIAPTVRGVSNAPTGTVTFLDGGVALGTGTVTAGVATFTTTALAVGTHSITAQYGGSANFRASTSSALSEVITASSTPPVTPDYTVVPTPSSSTVTAGSTASYSIALTPVNGYNGTVTFVCSGLPAKAACTFAPASIAAGGGAQSTTLTISTTAATADLVVPARPNSKPSAPTFLASLTGLGIVGLVLAGNGKHQKRYQMAVILGILLLIMTFSLVACGGGSSSGNSGGGGGGSTPGTPAGSYTVQVTATGTAGTNNGSTAAHSFNVSLTVQ